MNELLINKIQSTIQGELPLLSSHLRSWTKSHLIIPRQVEVFADSDGKGNTTQVWLVTDRTGANDSSYRVIYDDDTETFGLECVLQSGISWLEGWDGSFSETVEAM